MMQQIVLSMLASAAGALFTFLLQKQGFSAVVASCTIGLLGALFGHYLKMPQLPLLVFTGSFVGMTSLTLGSIPLITFAGLLAGLVYVLAQNIFVGIGGRLGTIAFISTLIVFYSILLFKNIFSTKKQ